MRRIEGWPWASVPWSPRPHVELPVTGRRQARLNPESKWIVEEVPQLRIIDDHLWDLVKERQRDSRSRVTTKDKGVRSERARRPRYLLSGLLRCGTCGDGFSKISQAHYGCSAARNKGTCDNLLTVRRDELEAKVLDGLRDHLMHPELVKTFVDEFRREVNRQAAEQNIRRNQSERDLERTERDIRRLIEAIKAGVPGAAVKDEMTTLEARRIDLLSQLKEAPPPMPRLHPNIAEVYRQKVDNLAEALNEERTCTEAAECIRELIEEIRLVPDNGKLKVELYGQLAALINLANEHPRSKATDVQITLVAGTRSHLYRTRFRYERDPKIGPKATYTEHAFIINESENRSNCEPHSDAARGQWVVALYRLSANFCRGRFCA